jgi:hypothetical protein
MRGAQLSSMRGRFLRYTGILFKFSLFTALDSGLKITAEL